MPQLLNQPDRETLLNIARNALTRAVNHEKPEKLNLKEFSPILQQKGASFVTLTIDGDLRGCIGTLEAWQPLAMDVQQRAVQAGLEDPRFPPVNKKELTRIVIEVSYLTQAQPLPYEEPNQLPALLRPHVDGLILSDGMRKATFLPQVWEQLPNPEDFLSHLCAKMGGARSLWRQKVLQASIYQVEDFKER
ncbi:MAG: AmmeMemoRadiSam system protein A [Anaerolineaceae bacterium]|jgi:AmmeMemoRadiSam system protein A